MWNRGVILASLLAPAACATGAYGVEPLGPNSYRLHLTSKPGEREQRHAELARRASALCDSKYQLTFQSERVTICTDACNASETTIAMLSCEAA